MSLCGQTVRIIVNEPYEWTYGNLFGTVICERGNKIRVRLTKAITGTRLTSDLIELQPWDQKGTFNPLRQNYSVIIAGALISEDLQETDHIIIGSVTFD